MTERPTSVRWMVVAILTAFSVTSYLQRMNISIAAQFMMPDLGLTQIRMGQIFSSFLIGYSIFQIPAGIWATAGADRQAKRRLYQRHTLANTGSGSGRSSSRAMEARRHTPGDPQWALHLATGGGARRPGD